MRSDRISVAAAILVLGWGCSSTTVSKKDSGGTAGSTSGGGASDAGNSSTNGGDSTGDGGSSGGGDSGAAGGEPNGGAGGENSIPCAQPSECPDPEDPCVLKAVCEGGVCATAPAGCGDGATSAHCDCSIVDGNCSVLPRDSDEDGQGDALCAPVPGTDCDDSSADAYQRNNYEVCDGLDNDCDGFIDVSDNLDLGGTTVALPNEIPVGSSTASSNYYSVVASPQGDYWVFWLGDRVIHGQRLDETGTPVVGWTEDVPFPEGYGSGDSMGSSFRVALSGDRVGILYYVEGQDDEAGPISFVAMDQYGDFEPDTPIEVTGGQDIDRSVDDYFQLVANPAGGWIATYARDYPRSLHRQAIPNALDESLPPSTVLPFEFDDDADFDVALGVSDEHLVVAGHDGDELRIAAYGTSGVPVAFPLEGGGTANHLLLQGTDGASVYSLEGVDSAVHATTSTVPIAWATSDDGGLISRHFAVIDPDGDPTVLCQDSLIHHRPAAIISDGSRYFVYGRSANTNDLPSGIGEAHVTLTAMDDNCEAHGAPTRVSASSDYVPVGLLDVARSESGFLFTWAEEGVLYARATGPLLCDDPQ